MAKTLKQLREDIANSAGSGQFAGLGVGPQGEPGKTIKRTKIKKILQLKKS